jgi:phage terminase small subunit
MPAAAAPALQQPQVAPTPALNLLAPKRQRFVRQYMVDLNATRAAKRAGYSEKSAKEIAYEMMADAKVAAAISELLALEAGVTRSRVVQELARIAFADPADVMDVDEAGNFSLRPFSEVSEDARAAIASIKQKPNEHGEERELKLHDKLGALNILARATGLLRDAPSVNINASVNVGVMVAPEVATEEDWEREAKVEQARYDVIEQDLKAQALESAG